MAADVTHFLRSADLTPGEQATVLDHAAKLKRDRDAALAASRSPVSYTHLTLPTIYSV